MESEGFLAQVSIECVINGKFSDETFVVTDAESGDVGESSEPRALRCDLFLAFDVGAPDNES
jgi:hypothetical protein